MSAIPRRKAVGGECWWNKNTDYTARRKRGLNTLRTDLGASKSHGTTLVEIVEVDGERASTLKSTNGGATCRALWP